MSRAVTLAQAARFHGHLGPWLALGLKAGRYARQQLRGTPFSLTAVVRCPGRTPYTCFIDGVQLGSGCTLGKGNIRHARGRRCRASFSGGDGAAHGRLTLELLPEVWDWLHRHVPVSGEEVVRLGRTVYRMSAGSLFRVSRLKRGTGSPCLKG